LKIDIEIKKSFMLIIDYHKQHKKFIEILVENIRKIEIRIYVNNHLHYLGKTKNRLFGGRIHRGGKKINSALYYPFAEAAIMICPRKTLNKNDIMARSQR